MVLDPPGVLDRINANLPDDIRVFGNHTHDTHTTHTHTSDADLMCLALFLAVAIRRTTGGFDSKNSVDSRIYEYLLPGYILAPEEPKPQRTRCSPTCTQLPPHLLFLFTLSPDVCSLCAAAEEGEAAAAEAAGALTQA
jgi:hypothetical protein